MADWKNELTAEFEHADEARARDNEGQARVCARRAAGIAIREYLARQARPTPNSSAYNLLRLLSDEPGLSPDLVRACDFLTLRVNEEFKLPVEVDLVSEARKLCRGLLTDWDGN
jgi:hypothetical protein